MRSRSLVPQCCAHSFPSLLELIFAVCSNAFFESHCHSHAVTRQRAPSAWFLTQTHLHIRTRTESWTPNKDHATVSVSDLVPDRIAVSAPNKLVIWAITTHPSPTSVSRPATTDLIQCGAGFERRNNLFCSAAAFSHTPHHSRGERAHHQQPNHHQSPTQTRHCDDRFIHDHAACPR